MTACVISPDGSLIVSASVDRTLNVWDARTWEEWATIPLPGEVTSMAVHPLRPLAVCGDIGGNVYLIQFVGIQYGPIIVTALDLGNGPAVRCPACFEQLPFEEGWLGQEITCPRSGCDGRMRVNPFVTRMRSPKRESSPDAAPWWRFLRR